MEILTYKNIYQLVGDQTSGSDECITKSLALGIAELYRKNVTSNLSAYLDNEYIDTFEVEDKPDLSNLAFTTKTFNTPSDATTLTTTATSLDINGYVIDYTATSDVDWIANIVVDGATITFDLAENSGVQRVGHITGVNLASKSDTITVTLEAYDSPYKYTYELIAKNAEAMPTITINGEPVIPVLEDGDYTYEYVMRVSSEDAAQESVPFTIGNGGATTWIDDADISVNPSSWDLKDSLTKSFTVSYSDTLYEKKWDLASGTILKNGSTTTTLTLYSSQESPVVSYNVSDNAASGSSFTYVKSGMELDAKASDINCAPSTITVSYNEASCTIDVTCTPDLYDIKWSDGLVDKTKSIGMSAGSFSGAVVTTLNGEIYTEGELLAVSNVDWITVGVSGRNIVVNYSLNSDDSDRVGIITISDQNGNSITCTVTQLHNAWSHDYTLIATGASSVPSITINGESVTPTVNGETYTAVYTVAGTGDDTAPSSIDWSISGGVPYTTWGKYKVSITPNTWNLDSSLSQDFTVSITKSGTKYQWGTTSGTIVKDSTSSVSVDSSDTSYSGSSYSVSCPGSMTAIKDGMSFAATAASNSDIGNITVTCTEGDATGENATITVYYEQSDYLVWKSSVDPDSVSFTYSGGTKTVTMKTWQEWAIAGTTYGTVNSYTETITCTELRSTSARSWVETFTNDGLTVKVACTQSANYKSWSSSIDPSSMTFTWEGGTQTATMKTWWWWGGSDTTHHDQTSYTCTVTVPQNASGGSGSESFTHDGLTKSVSWKQSARPAETWGDWVYVFSGTAGTVSYSWDCVKGTTASDSITSYKYRTSSWGNTENKDISYSEGSGSGPTSNNTSTTSTKTGTYSTLTQSGSGKTLTRSWLLNVRPAETWGDWLYYFYWSNGSTTTTFISCDYAWDQTSDDSYNAWNIVSGRKRTSSYGNVQEEDVSYSGSKGVPSGSNTSTTSRSDSGTITQSLSNKTISWIWTQAAKLDGWGEWSYEFYWYIDGSKATAYNETLSYNGRASKITASNVVSTRSRVNSITGSTQIEDVAYSGTINGPTSDNTTSETKSFNTELVLNGSGKSITAIVVQYGTSNINVVISGSAKANGTKTAVVKFGLTQAVPFDINVTGTCLNNYDEEEEAFSITIPAGSTTTSSTVYFTSSGTISNPVIASFEYLPKSKTVNNVTYHVGGN